MIYLDNTRSKRRRTAIAIAIATLLGVGIWASTRMPVEHAVAVGAAKARGVDNHPVTAMPRTTTTAQSIVVAPLGPQATRAALYDARDIIASIRAVAASGSPDEKGWAATLLMECSTYVDPPSVATPVAWSIPGGLPAPPALNAGQLQAKAEIEKRCIGVKAIPLKDRVALSRSLSGESRASTSDYARIIAARRHGDRVSADEQRIVTAALYGDDPLLRYEAAQTVIAMIDRRAPGGDERLLAFAVATNGDNQTPAFSDFEMLQRCAALPRCVVEDAAPALSTQVVNDAARMHALIEEKRPLQDILSFR
jgi:uncharacterized membrane protein